MRSRNVEVVAIVRRLRYHRPPGGLRTFAEATRYTRGVDLSGSLEGAGGIGGLLARSSGYSSGNWTSHAYHHADGNGNITCLIDTNQSVVASYRYDPFGNTISQSGSLADDNTYRFSSKEIHTNSLMYYYGYRFYDPNLQRWINRDPLGGWGAIIVTTARGYSMALPNWDYLEGPNLYTYVFNSPPSYVDNNGEWGLGILGGGSAEGGVGYGAGGTMVGGGGLFAGGPQGLHTGTFLSGGGFVGAPGFRRKVPSSCPQKPWTAGAFGGVGLGPYLTNASDTGYGPGGLGGPFTQYNINIGAGPVQFSLSLGISGGTWIASVTVGPGLGVSASGYPTETVPQ